MWVIIGIVVAIGAWLLFGFWKTASMNRDPVQLELADLILEMMEGEASESAQTLFVISSQRLFMTRMIEPNEHQTRYAHALSLAETRLNQEGKQVARSVIRTLA